MEEIIDAVEVTPQRKRGFSVFIALVSTLVSIVSTVYCFYLASLGTWWFIPLGICFAVGAIFLIIPLFIKDDYKAMHLQGVIQIIGVLLLMPYLLFMILWNDPDGKMNYTYLTYVVFGVGAAIKALLAVVSRIGINKNYHPLRHAYSNNALIMASYLVIIIQLTLVNMFHPGETLNVFENLLKEKPLWTYIIGILVNASFTVLAALLALSTTIRAKTKEELSTANKIKHTIKWFNDNEISMFVGLMFTFYLAVLSLINMKQSFLYILLFVYYVGTATIRIINYLWHKWIQKRSEGNPIKDNRLSSWILLFDAFTYSAFSNVLIVAAVFMMIQKSNAGANIYLFLFFNIPMALMRLSTTKKSIANNKRENNTYRLGVSLIGLVSLFFTLLEIIAIASHGLSVTWFRFFVIIGAIIVAKIAIIVVSIIFGLHWFRSIILNRRSKERKYARENNR